MAVQSTAGKVKNALAEAGVIRGLVSPVEYLDRKADSLSNEVRFVLAANHEVLRQKRGAMIRFKPATFINDLAIPRCGGFARKRSEKNVSIDTKFG